MRPNPYSHIERHQIDSATFAAWLADKHVREIRLLYASGRVLVRRHTKPRRRDSVGFDHDPDGALLGHEVRVDGVQRVACAPALDLAQLDALMGE
jgi:hypothetical protein